MKCCKGGLSLFAAAKMIPHYVFASTFAPKNVGAILRAFQSNWVNPFLLVVGGANAICHRCAINYILRTWYDPFLELCTGKRVSKNTPTHTRKPATRKARAKGVGGVSEPQLFLLDTPGPTPE